MIENHWGVSMDPDAVVEIVSRVRAIHGSDSMHTLVDFGNWPDNIDRYDAIRKVMPFAHAVHAKVNDIDAEMNHPRFDHATCLNIARVAGYTGHLGIEYEGPLDPIVGITRAVKKLTPLL